MNLGDMRAIVRRELRDEDVGNYRWSDDELNRHIAHAVREFSEAVPLEQKAVLATSAGVREISLVTLADRVMVEAVEYPVGQFPRSYQRFSLWGDTLTLLGNDVPDGSAAGIYYGKLHTLDAGASTIPPKMEDLVAAGVEGYAALAQSVYVVNRVNTGGSGTAEEFLRWGRDRLRFFRSELKRLGRQNRVRVKQLYTLYSAPAARTRDFGP